MEYYDTIEALVDVLNANNVDCVFYNPGGDQTTTVMVPRKSLSADGGSQRKLRIRSRSPNKNAVGDGNAESHHDTSKDQKQAKRGDGSDENVMSQTF